MGHSRPWMKFYPSDWRADQALRICSLAARGLWIEMLCIMHESSKPGLLMVNDNPVTETHLALLTGTPPNQLSELIDELESAGVFSRNRDGVIYSRRMTRDQKRAKMARLNGTKGGNPTLCNERRNQAWVNPPDKPPDKGRVKTQRPESRVQKESGLGLERRSLSPGRDPPAANRPEPDPEKFSMTMDWTMDHDVETRLEQRFMPELGQDGFWRQVARFMEHHVKRGTADSQAGFQRSLENWLDRADDNHKGAA